MSSECSLQASILGGLRFGLLSVLSFAVTIGLTSLGVEVFGLDALYAHIITLVLVFLFNFVMLVTVVFPNQTGPRGHFFLTFLLVSFLFRPLEWCVYAFLVVYLGFEYRISILFVAPLFAGLKYLSLQSFAYKKKHNTVNG